MTSAMPAETFASERLIRSGDQMEIAALVSSLASEQVAFESGATFSANGGQHMV